MAAIERKTKRYPTDPTDGEWARIAPLLPKPAKRGRECWNVRPDPNPWTLGALGVVSYLFTSRKINSAIPATHHSHV